jgi:small-conductance mechanosensitive channel
LLGTVRTDRPIGESSRFTPTTPAQGGAASLPTTETDRRANEARVAYRDILVRNLRIVVVVISVVVLARVWRVDVQAIAALGIGKTIAGALFDIIITLILASAAWGILTTAIRYAVPEGGGESELEAGEIGGEGGSRLQTLIPLLGRFLLAVLVVMAGLIILSELGIDIGPLIAGAGIVGLAVGFGAQTLVNDVLSGVFFLVDDALRVGEYVDVGDVTGTVEHVSIRSLRLRHHNGPLHTIPFGQIKHLTNYSRDWAIMKLEIRVPFDTDLEKVRKIIKSVGLKLMEDLEHGSNLLEPVKSQGVHHMDDSAFVLRVKFMAKPGEQFVLRREVFHRLQETFAKNGINFAPRHVIVDTGAGPMPITSATAAAAAAAGDSPQVQSTTPPVGPDS